MGVWLPIPRALAIKLDEQGQMVSWGGEGFLEAHGVTEDEIWRVQRFLRKNPKATVTQLLDSLSTLQTASSLRREMIRQGYRFDHRARPWLGPWEHYRPRTATGEELTFLRRKLGCACLIRLSLNEGEAAWLLKDPKRLRAARCKGLPVPKVLFPKDFRLGRCGSAPKRRKAWPAFGPADGRTDAENPETGW